MVGSQIVRELADFFHVDSLAVQRFLQSVGGFPERVHPIFQRFQIVNPVFHKVVEQGIHFLQIVDSCFLGIGSGVAAVKIGLQQGNQIRGFRFGQFCLYLFEPFCQSGNLLSDIPNGCIGCFDPAVELTFLRGDALVLHCPDGGAFVNSGQ